MSLRYFNEGRPNPNPNEFQSGARLGLSQQFVIHVDRREEGEGERESESCLISEGLEYLDRACDSTEQNNPWKRSSRKP